MDNNSYFQSEIHKLLKLGPDLSKPYEPENPAQMIVPGAPFGLPVGELITEVPAIAAAPIAPSKAMAQKSVQMSVASASAFVSPADQIVPRFGSGVAEQEDESGMVIAPVALRGDKAVKKAELAAAKAAQRKAYADNDKKSWPAWIVYPLVFALAFGVFYGVLNFQALTAQMGSWFAKSEEEIILQEDLTEYNKWIGGYFFAVGDREKLEANNDIDADGLTNLEEFRIKTNPTITDSDDDGTSDGIEVINGTNPWGAGKMTKKQLETLEQLDLIQINNRISFNAAANSGTLQQNNHSANFDQSLPGRLSIPKLQMQVPLIFTQSPADFDNDLTRGVVHYPGTALPGENGVVYISGHSSDYFWKKHAFRQVFAKINALEVGDDIFVDVYGKDGKTYNYRYRVVSESVFAPADQRQFIDGNGAKLNLSTCWPIGTQKDRYVVSAELVQ